MSLYIDIYRYIHMILCLKSCGVVLSPGSFKASGHPLFRGTCRLSRAPLKSKGGGKTSIHFNADPHTADLLLLTIVFVNQLSIYGAVADWCHELTQRAEAHLSLSTGRPVAEMTGDQAQHVPSEVVSSPTKGPLWSQ